MLDFTQLEGLWLSDSMKKRLSRYLQEAEEFGNVREVIRKHNVSEQSFYRWRQKYGGMQTSEVRRLKELERENSELKKMVAEQVLDIRMLTRCECKKMVSLTERRTMAEYLVDGYGVSERRSCRVMGLPRSTHRSRPGQTYPDHKRDRPTFASLSAVRVSQDPHAHGQCRPRCEP